ncbi:MAG: winged helix-turn-helix transcriptional regulator [Methylobacter sp.]|nr:winged helix-turn-helix transcriptional regulator [Methylobacter sp.]
MKIKGKHTSPDDANIAIAAHCLKAMSHPLRLKILCILGNDAICVQQIVEQVGTSQSNISQHLAILRPVKFAENEEGIILKFKHKT